VPTLLLLRPRWGVFLALVFHQTINLMPTTYAGSPYLIAGFIT
jgi:hypothetical protein